MQLNEGQLEAVNTIEGQLVIVACPGSGKTTTLLKRIHHMTEDLDIDPSSILMVTFSKAAADEMKARYRKNYSTDSMVYFGTIHSFCLALIKKFSPEVAREGVLSEHDATDFFYKQLQQTQDIGNKLDFINDLMLDIGLLSNTCVQVSDYNPKCCKDKRLFLNLFNAYNEYKSNIGRIDYDDMLSLSYNILCNNSEALSWVRNRYKYVLVDEYQDVSALQRDIIYKLAGENGNLAVVGDDDQSIYGFRGASSSIMLNFRNDYPNSKVIYLNTNYRSNSEIVSRSGILIKNNKERYAKEFESSRGPGGIVQTAVAKDRVEEISMLTNNIKQVVSSGISGEDIAVIYRINKQGTLIAKMFSDSGIEFKTNDALSCIYDHWIYNDIWSFYRMSNGKGTKIDFQKTLNHPNRFLHDEELINSGLDIDYMIRVVKGKKYEEWKEKRAIDEIHSYFDTLKSISQAKGPGKALDILIKQGKYLTYLKEYAEYRNEDYSELVALLDEIKKDAYSCCSWEEWDRLAKDEIRKIHEATQGKAGVTLTTMHKAKGLEWSIVYIVDCVEGKCPYVKAKSSKELEEERRLFYVAMTRAKDRLVLMRSNRDGQTILTSSRYLKEVGIVEDKPQKNTNNNTFTKKNTNTYRPSKRSRYGSRVRSTSKSISIPDIKVGDRVKSMLYGEGSIKSIARDGSGNPVGFTAHFVTDGDKSFPYPRAFKSGLTKL